MAVWWKGRAEPIWLFTRVSHVLVVFTCMRVYLPWRNLFKLGIVPPLPFGKAAGIAFNAVPVREVFGQLT